MKNSLGYEVREHVPHCDYGKPGEIVERFDLYACTACDKWLEKPCGPECARCPFRGAPEKPSMVR